MIRRGSKPRWVKALALTRIKILFKIARADLERSSRYVDLALKIARKYNVRIPYKRAYCKKCHVLWVPGKTVRIRTDPKNRRIVYTCLKCGHKQYYSYSMERKRKT